MNPAGNSQQAVIDFLERPATHGGAPVKRIDTHAAAVFLAGDRALKIKRAVRFPFLDYSTLEQAPSRLRGRDRGEPSASRRRSIAAWWRSRARKTARSPSAARRAGGMGGGDAPLRRDADARPSRRAGRIDRALADALGRAVARAHAAAPVDTAAGFVDELAEVIAQNDAELRAAPDLFPRRRRQRADAGNARRICAACGRCSRARERAGLVRRCHGDLHLGNIVLLDGAPVLFDAIEFDPKIATGDVLYDLAFLLMDLIERGLRPRGQHRAQPLSHRDAAGRGPRCARRAAAVPVAARGDPRQGHRGAARAGQRRGRRAKRARLFRAGRQAAGAAAAASGRRGRAVGHRQVAARPRACGRNSPRAGRGGAAQRRRAQSAVRHRRNRPPAGDGLCAGRHGTSLCRARRQGAAGARRRPFGDRGRGVRATPASGRRSRKRRRRTRSTGCS